MMCNITFTAYLLFNGHSVMHEITLNITFQGWINYPYLDGSEAGELTKAELHIKQRNSHNSQRDEVRNNKCACEKINLENQSAEITFMSHSSKKKRARNMNDKETKGQS